MVSPGTWEVTMFFMRNLGQESDLVDEHESVFTGHLLCLLALIIHEIPCEFGELQCMLQINFILDSKFIVL